MSKMIDCTQWPLNIFRVIVNDESATEKSLPKDFAGTLMYALITFLDILEEWVLIYRYQMGLTYHDIGIQFGLTGTRIRQIHDKAIHRLRQPSRLCFLEYGVVWQMERYKAGCCERFYNMGYQDGFKRGRGKTNEPLYKNPYMQKNEFLVTPIEESPIDILDLSPRAYNSLRRSHICTVGEVLSLSKTELLKVKNFGKLSLAELEEKLARYDFKLKEK